MIRMRTVGGTWTPMPTPSAFQVDIEPITKAERASDGKMFIELITNKRKISMSWLFLSKDNAETLLDMVVDNIIVEIEYPDPKDKALVQKTFYTSGKTSNILSYVNTIGGWRDVSFNAIEI